MLLMSVIIDDMNAEAYVDNIQLAEVLGEMHPYVIMDISISVKLIFYLLRCAEVLGCGSHKKYSDICVPGRGVGEHALILSKRDFCAMPCAAVWIVCDFHLLTEV